MKNTLLTVLCLLLLAAPVVSQEVLSDSIFNALQIGMDGFMQRYNSPSITVVIVHDQEVIFGESIGYVDLENKIPASIDSKYPILSVTKPFTATMLMQLYEKGLLDINDDAGKFIPELSLDKNDRAGKITLLQLATHTSGLPRNSPADIGFAQQVDKWLLTGEDIPVIQMSDKEEFLPSLRYVEREYPVYQLKRYGDRTPVQQRCVYTNACLYSRLCYLCRRHVFYRF